MVLRRGRDTGWAKGHWQTEMRGESLTAVEPSSEWVSSPTSTTPDLPRLDKLSKMWYNKIVETTSMKESK